MRTQTSKIALIVAVSTTLGATAAHAGDPYVLVTGALVFQNDSDNIGAFDGAFSTGPGTAISAGTVLPDGTPVGWNTEFDTGYAVSGAIGKYYGPFRAEIEVAYQNVGVETHTGVSAAGIDLSAEDAGVLVSGAPANLGVSVADLVADGQGQIDTIFVMANVLYEFGMAGPLKPYIGGGIGIGFADVNYSPSAVGIIDDGSTEFAYQAMVGFAYTVAPRADVVLGYRYRATNDVGIEASLFDADFEVENRASMAEAGLRIRF
ncbi:MAG: P44/Msp2 family outer membrane protein [Pseudomonadota bacterium]